MSIFVQIWFSMSKLEEKINFYFGFLSKYLFFFMSKSQKRQFLSKFWFINVKLLLVLRETWFFVSKLKHKSQFLSKLEEKIDFYFGFCVKICFSMSKSEKSQFLSKFWFINVKLLFFFCLNLKKKVNFVKKFFFFFS